MASEAKRHKFSQNDTMNGQPIKRCVNAGCHAVWLHGKSRPMSNCPSR